jgi:hypothetical protein
MKTVKTFKDGEPIPKGANYLNSRTDETTGKLIHIYEIELEASDKGKDSLIPDFECGNSKSATGFIKVINQDMEK